jgi:energy-coupling factor transporter ATP-binding protein EcfA2
MSHIKRFAIEGLIGREETVTRQLDRHVNIIYGVNGTGKTSLLKILESALRGDASILRNVVFRSAVVEIYSITYDRLFTYTIQKPPTQHVISSELTGRVLPRIDDPSIFYSVFGNPKSFEWSWEISPKPPRHDQSWKHVFLPTSRLMQGLDRSVYRDRSVSPEEILDQQFADSFHRHWLALFSEVQSRAGGAQARGFARILNELLWGGIESPEMPPSARPLDPKVAYERLETFLQRAGAKLGSSDDFVQQYNSDSRIREIVDQIYSVESEIETIMEPTNKLGAVVNRLFSRGKEVVFEPSKVYALSSTGEPISVGSLSSGEKHVLQILLGAIRAEASSLIVDEPELSMHIDWQRDLISTIQTLNQGVQIIFATHAPEIMANVDDDKIWHL